MKEEGCELGIQICSLYIANRRLETLKSSQTGAETRV